MSISRRTLIQSAAASAVLPAVALRDVLAQQIEMARIVVGFPAGGTTDAVTRRVAERLVPGYARVSIVDNRVGAGGQIAVSHMKTVPTDGSVLLMTPMAMLCVYPYTYKKLPYDPFADVMPVSRAVTFGLGLAVGPAVPSSVKTIGQFVEWCKANPGKASFGSGATGSTLHLTGALLGRAAGVDLTHVGYRGSAGLLADVAGGTLPACVSPIGDMLAFHRSNRLRVIATSGQARSRFLPEVATFAESGYKELTIDEWYGFYAPANTPEAVVQRASRGIAAALTAPEVVESLATFGMEPAPTSPAELATLTRTDAERWARNVKAIGFTSES